MSNKAFIPTRHPSTQQDQHARFVETARALGCNEDEAAFDEKLRAVVRHKPKGEQPDRPEPKTSSE